MVMSINEIKQVIYEADKKIRNLVMFASPSMVKSIKEALPSIEEKIVIQETEWVKDGQVVVVGRETFEKWVNHDFDYKAESEGQDAISN
jgi:uroporphyrinogen-III synthase